MRFDSSLPFSHSPLVPRPTACCGSCLSVRRQSEALPLWSLYSHEGKQPRRDKYKCLVRRGREAPIERCTGQRLREAGGSKPCRYPGRALYAWEIRQRSETGTDLACGERRGQGGCSGLSKTGSGRNWSQSWARSCITLKAMMKNLSFIIGVRESLERFWA